VKDKNKDFKPTAIRLSETQRIHELFFEQPYLRQFLRGELDEFLDSPALLEKHGLLEKRDSKNEELKHFAGTYMNYRLYNDKNFIHVRPIKIDKFGKVTIYNKDRTGAGPLYKGKASLYSNSLLSIFINERNNKPYFFHMMFFVGTFSSSQKYCSGISTILTSTSELRAGREILFLLKKNISGLYYREYIPFSSKGRLNILEKRIPGISNYLLEKGDNFITVSPNEKIK